MNRWSNYIGWKAHIARTRWQAHTAGCTSPTWHPDLCDCDPRAVRTAGPVARHPWVIMYCFGLVVGFWTMLWAGLEGWWLPFGIAAYGFASSAAGLLLWMRQTRTPLPRFRDYLTLVKTITKLRS